eukprot:1152517-Pelagomonas_calceolata.AAC.2
MAVGQAPKAPSSNQPGNPGAPPGKQDVHIYHATSTDALLIVSEFLSLNKMACHCWPTIGVGQQLVWSTVEFWTKLWHAACQLERKRHECNRKFSIELVPPPTDEAACAVQSL